MAFYPKTRPRIYEYDGSGVARIRATKMRRKSPHDHGEASLRIATLTSALHRGFFLSAPAIIHLMGVSYATAKRAIHTMRMVFGDELVRTMRGKEALWSLRVDVRDKK